MQDGEDSMWQLKMRHLSTFCDSEHQISRILFVIRPRGASFDIQYSMEVFFTEARDINEHDTADNAASLFLARVSWS